MKKTTVLYIVLSLSSIAIFCFVFIILPQIIYLIFKPIDVPYGKWQSLNPEIIMDIKYGSSGDPDTGQYIKNGNNTNIHIHFDTKSRELIILNESSLELKNGQWVVNANNPYFNGTFKVKDGKLYYYLKEKWQIETGYDVIVFEKIEDYEPLSDAD